MHIHTTFCIFVNGPKKSGYDSTYYILHFSISRFGLHTTFYICDFECLLKLHTTFYIFDFRPGTYIRHLHLPVGEVNRAASTFYIWRVNNMRANSYTYYIPDPAYICPALVVSRRDNNSCVYIYNSRYIVVGNCCPRSLRKGGEDGIWRSAPLNPGSVHHVSANGPLSYLPGGGRLRYCSMATSGKGDGDINSLLRGAIVTGCVTIVGGNLK